MAIKTILAGVSGGTATDGAVELACRLARRFGAHLECLHVRIDVDQIAVSTAGGIGMPLGGRWIDELANSAAALADQTRVAFTAAAARHNLAVVATAEPGRSGAAWREETGDAPAIVSRRARFFDLVVLGRSERVIDEPHSDAVEQTLILSGRPVLLAPAETPTTIGTTIAVGWNGSAQAVRAVTAALPFLKEARAVPIITVDARYRQSADSLKEYLVMQGVAATVRWVGKVSGADAGAQLLSAARDDEADLLVIGGYGQAPWRETLFGGTTRDIVGVSLLPLLIAH